MMLSQKHFEKTLVIGLGQTGLSVARFLSKKGEAFAVTDSRDIPPGFEVLKNEYPDVACFTGGFSETVFSSADRLVVSPGVDLSDTLIQSAIRRGIPVIGDVELFAQYVDAPVVVITGSNGKSTVTTMLGNMAKDALCKVGVGGNIGVPVLDLLNQQNELYVLELSSFQLETLSSLKPVAAVVLNVSEDHMDRYRDLSHYSDVKASVYHEAENAIVNLDDARVSAMIVNNNKISFSLGQPSSPHDWGVCQVGDEQWLCHGETLLCKKEALFVAGDHNMANALAALALGDVLGLPVESMLASLKNFKGLPHRTQYVLEHEGVTYFNDSKATNVGACIAALQGLDTQDDTKTVIILGGESKDADFSDLTSVIERTCRAVVLMGRDALLIKKSMPSSVEHLVVSSLEEAVIQAGQWAKKGDRVLLSPACASFDMFADFEDRGNQFIQLVQRLVQ